jgi:peptidyl-Lys metalloendopeptidase
LVVSSWMAATGLLLLACAGSTLARTEVDPQALRFRLETRAVFTVGAPVSILFTLENLSDRPIRVLTWYTPLEGLRGEIFRVTRDGKSVDYRGKMVKRGNPTSADYVRVAPRSSVSAEVDLSTGYDLTVPGAYRVEFVGHLHDVAFDAGTETPASREPHALDPIGSGAGFRVQPP